MNERDKRRLRGLVLKHLEYVYPEGLTIGFLRALLLKWYEPHFIDLTELRKALSYLLDNQYLELTGGWQEDGVLKLTPKGAALVKGQVSDLEVTF